MSGFLLSIFRDESLILGVLLLLGPLLFAAGVGLAVVGYRGKFRSGRPMCRKCGFDLSGSMAVPASAAPDAAGGAVRIGPELASLFPAKCPECGGPLARPGAILPGEVRRRPIVLALGMLLALLGVVPTVWIAARSLQRVDWNHYKSTSALLTALEKGDTTATNQLQYRFAAGLKDPVVTDEVLRIYKAALTDAAGTKAGGASTAAQSASMAAGLAKLNAMDGLVTSLATSGQITNAMYAELLPLVAPAADWKLTTGTVNRASMWLPTQLSAPATPVGSMFGSKFQAQIKLAKISAVDSEGNDQELSSMGGMGYFYPQSGGGGSVNLRHRLKPGTYTVKADFRRTFSNMAPPFEDTFTTQSTLRIIGDKDITVTVVTDRETGQQIVDRLKIQEIGIVNGYNNDKQIRLMFTATGLPADWSFIAVVQQGNRKYTLGPISVAQENAGTNSVQSSGDLLFGSLKGFTDEPVDLILMPGGRKHAWNKEKVKLWQGTIRIPNLKVAKPRSYDDFPQTDNVPVTAFDRASVTVETESEKAPEPAAPEEK